MEINKDIVVCGEQVFVAPYKPEHLNLINIPSLHAQYGLASREAWAKLYTRGPAFTVFVNEKLLGCGGVIRLWPGVGDAWVIPTSLIFDYKRLTYVLTIELMNQIIEIGQYVRIQAYIQQGKERNKKFVERLGFTYEGPMPKFFGNIDYWRYAKIIERETK